MFPLVTLICSGVQLVIKTKCLVLLLKYNVRFGMTMLFIWHMQLDKPGSIGDSELPAGQRIMGSAMNAMATKVRAPF
jgi:hypothetical protein